MLSAFWSGLGSQLAKQWLARVVTPAAVFWTAGLAAVWWNAHGDRVRSEGWAAELEATVRPLEQLPAVGQVVLIAGALLLLVASALIAERLTLPLLRLLEGYWIRPAWLRSWLIRRRRMRRREWAAEAERLRRKQARGDLSLAEQAELRDLEDQEVLDELQQERRLELLQRARSFSAEDLAVLARRSGSLRRSPREDELGMPTRLGDLLRAAERRPYEKYGLDAVVCWYRLWMVLPPLVRTEIAATRLELDRGVRACMWGALFIVWTPWLWWVAVPVAVLVPLAVYRFSMLAAAALFAELVETAFDLHRMNLYDALNLPRPASTAEERHQGQRLTALLWHGRIEPSVAFVAPSPAAYAERSA